MTVGKSAVWSEQDVDQSRSPCRGVAKKHGGSASFGQRDTKLRQSTRTDAGRVALTVAGYLDDFSGEHLADGVFTVLEPEQGQRRLVGRDHAIYVGLLEGTLPKEPIQRHTQALAPLDGRL
jgi:hypothetical protein